MGNCEFEIKIPIWPENWFASLDFNVGCKLSNRNLNLSEPFQKNVHERFLDETTDLLWSLESEPFITVRQRPKTLLQTLFQNLFQTLFFSWSQKPNNRRSTDQNMISPKSDLSFLQCTRQDNYNRLQGASADLLLYLRQRRGEMLDNPGERLSFRFIILQTPILVRMIVSSRNHLNIPELTLTHFSSLQLALTGFNWL